MKTDKTYLRNRRFIRRSDTAKNENLRAKNLTVKYNKNLHMEVDEEGLVSKKDIPDVNGIMRRGDSSPNPNNVEFDRSIFICKADWEKWKKEHLEKKKKEENLTPAALCERETDARPGPLLNVKDTDAEQLSMGRPHSVVYRSRRVLVDTANSGQSLRSLFM